MGILKNILFWRENSGEERIKRLKKLKIILILVLILAVVGAWFLFKNNTDKDKVKAENKIIRKVETLKVNLDAVYADTIEVVGTVKAEAQVDIVALTSGTVRGLDMEIGDSVYKNKVLANFFNSSLLTGYNNAQTNLSNAKNSLDSTKLVTDETIKQAEIGVNRARELFISTEIALKTVQDSLANAKLLQIKGSVDTKQNAITSYYNYLNSVNNILDQVNYIILAEDGEQLAGISKVLAVKNSESLRIAKGNYLLAREAYNLAFKIKPTAETVKINFEKVIEALALSLRAVDDAIIVLNNTITYEDFSESSLNAQKISFSNLRSTSIAAKKGAEQVFQALGNLTLTNKQENDALENAVKAAENQLNLAQIGYENALVSLESAKQAKEQNIIGSRTSVDSAQGQLNISGVQVSDLTVRAPISGTITKKLVELGAEVKPGQKIGEISQTDNVKVEINLASEDIYRVKVGQPVIIRKDLSAVITLISPAADSVTRKVGVEISFNNKNKELIAGTFVDVTIPVEELKKTNEQSFFIPLRAVNIDQNESYVFTSVDGKAKKNIVSTGKAKGSLIEILAGLKTDDELIIEGNKSLMDGDEIVIGN